MNKLSNKRQIMQVLLAGSLICTLFTAFSAVHAAQIMPLPAAEVSLIWLRHMPMHYYKVYGHYPERWADIVSAGLFQAELRSGMRGELLVDPDDGRLDFLGDMAYIYRGPQTPPAIEYPDPQDQSRRLSETAVEAQLTYDSMFDSFVAAGVEIPAEWRSEENRLRFAMAAVINHAFRQHFAYYGEGLQSMEELLASGLAPFTAESVFPATGELLFAPESSAGFIVEGPAPGYAAKDVMLTVHPRGPDGEAFGRFSY